MRFWVYERDRSEREIKALTAIRVYSDHFGLKSFSVNHTGPESALVSVRLLHAICMEDLARVAETINEKI